MLKKDSNYNSAILCLYFFLSNKLGNMFYNNEKTDLINLHIFLQYFDVK
jgi:hypothetical protein